MFIATSQWDKYIQPLSKTKTVETNWTNNRIHELIVSLLLLYSTVGNCISIGLL